MRCIVTTVAKLRLYVDLRMYDELDAYADDCIRDKGWKLLLSRMKKVRDKGDSLDAFRPESVAPGKVRDAIVHLLALDAVKGIDIDLLQTFRNLKPSSLRHLRSLVIPIAIKALEEQIQKHNTFFMDIEEMATTAYAVLVQDIVNSRNEEITSIGSNPSVLQVLSSYYGFSILTLGSNIQRRHQWEAPGAAEALKEVTKSLGATVRFIQSKPIIQAQKVFKNCTEETANLLANIARMAVHMGISTQTNSLNKLKNQGDSRTIPFLLAKLERVRHYRVKNSLQEALAGIGGETIVDILVDSYPSYNATRIKAMGRIRSERTIKILEDIVKSRCSQERKSAAIWGLGNLDALDSVDVIEMHLTSKNQKVKTASIRALMKLGPDGHKHILENLDSMIGTLSRETYTHTILQGLVKIPKIRDSKEFVKSISSSLLKAYEKDSQRKNSRTRTYWERQRMLRRTAGSTPRQILDAFRGFPKLPLLSVSRMSWDFP